MTINIFDRTITLLSKALDTMSLRHEVISSNIANQDTPNYKAKDVRFKDELESAIKSEVPDGNYKTNPRHISFSDSVLSSEAGDVVTRLDSGNSYDNNSVNVELEMANMAKNTIMYNTAAQLISNKFKILSNAIKEGK